ncbi:MAG: hypothetical protein J5586_01115 [Clostridia bacterium]|nr:hypothetical protein [Clostridia bacterium]
MRSKAKKAYCFIALLAAAACMLSGCARISGAIKDAGTKTTDAPLLEPTLSPTDEPLPTEKTNPVFIFLTGFISEYGRASAGLLDSVFMSGDAELTGLYAALAGDEALVSRLFVTVGMLTQDEGRSTFSGTFTGAYAGSGQLRHMNSFSYAFDNGDELVGTLTSGTDLKCAYTADGETIIMTVALTESGYVMRVERGGMLGCAEIAPDGLRYERFAAKDAPDGDMHVFPEVAGTSILTYSGGAAALSE